MGSTPWVASIIMAALGGTFLTELFRWIVGRFRGRIAKRSEIERAWDRADEEAKRRRIAEEHASHLRRDMLDSGCFRPEDIPAFPSYSGRAQ